MTQKPKIKWTLFCYMAAFTVVVVLLLWLLQVVFLEDIYKGIKINELKESAKKVETLSEKPLSLNESAYEVAKDNSICIVGYRIEKSGAPTLIVDCDVIMSCAIHGFSISDVARVYSETKENGGRSLSTYVFDPKTDSFNSASNKSDSDGPMMIVYSFIAKDSRGNDMVFLLNSMISPVDATVKTLNHLIVVIGAVMVGLSLILTLILSRTIAKPITDLSKRARLLAVGDYRDDFKGGNYREINDLADSLAYASDELSKTDRLRSELIANTSHDLRTPLTMITGYAEMMRDLPDENTPENAQIIIDESKRLTTLVNDMLDISKLESGSLAVKPEIINVTETVYKELFRYSELCKREGYRIDFVYDRPVTLLTDKQLLLQALFNLVNNAITYTGEDKTVKVEQTVVDLGADGQYLRLSVKDSGEGIPKEKLDMIWDRYYKIDTPHKRASYGSGLGLSIVRKATELIDGRCGVMSSNGHGSIFWIEIPIR